MPVQDSVRDDSRRDERKIAFVLRAGVEVSGARWVHLRGDLRFRQVNDRLGVAGASAAFEEDRLGGFGAGLQRVLGH